MKVEWQRKIKSPTFHLPGERNVLYEVFLGKSNKLGLQTNSWIKNTKSLVLLSSPWSGQSCLKLVLGLETAIQRENFQTVFLERAAIK